MLILRTIDDTRRIPSRPLREHVSCRLSQVSATDDTYPLEVTLIVVEAKDHPADIEAAAGFPLMTSAFDQLPFNHPDFYPNHEFLEEYRYEHHRFFELFIAASDSGAGTAIFIPDEEGIDADLLAMCRAWATPAVITP